MQERFRPMAMGERFFHSDSAGTEELQDIPQSGHNVIHCGSPYPVAGTAGIVSACHGGGRPLDPSSLGGQQSREDPTLGRPASVIRAAAPSHTSPQLLLPSLPAAPSGDQSGAGLCLWHGGAPHHSPVPQVVETARDSWQHRIGLWDWVWRLGNSSSEGERSEG